MKPGLHRLVLAVIVLILIIMPAQLRAATELTAEQDGAFFRIVVPDNWNGDLVIWAHGFTLAPVGPVSDLGPLAQLQLSEGYAVAASSYSQRG